MAGGHDVCAALSGDVNNLCVARSADARSRSCDLQVGSSPYIMDIVSGATKWPRARRTAGPRSRDGVTLVHGVT